MDVKIARILVENLIDRMMVESDGRWRLEGSLSSMEVEALNVLVGSTTGPDQPVPEPADTMTILVDDETSMEPRAVAASTSPVSTISLNLTSLDYDEPQDADVTLCLDFGTAMSKAAASLGAEDEFLELKLGERAGQEGLEYPVVSSLFISDTGMVYFGEEAVKQSLLDQISGVSRFDSLKQEITLGSTDTSLDKQLVGVDCNPTDVEITKGCLITAYLAYLTDMACTELEASHNRSRYVKRRFALPVFDGEHAKWGESQLRYLVAKAQVLADTFHGKWQGGIDITVIRDAYNHLLELGVYPDYLVTDSVLEPIAAAATRIHEDFGSKREMVMVVDVGAGTTDFALFMSKQKEDELFKIFPVPGTVKGVRQAGDTIDNALRVFILDDAHIDSASPQRALIDSHLKLRIRQFKENLFDNGALHYVLKDSTEGTVQLADFLESKPIKRFEELLHKNFFREALLSADKSYFSAVGNVPLKVVLTGGGAALPMIQDMGEGTVTIDSVAIKCELARSVPEWVESYPGMRDEYPQLAVALGGASDELPELGPTFEKFGGIGGNTDQWHLKGKGW